MQPTVLKNTLLAILLVVMVLFLFIPLPKPVFPLLMVILMLLWVVSFYKEGIYAWADIPMLFLLLGTFAFGKAFSLLGIGSFAIPIYITEAALAASLIFLLARAKSPVTLWQEWRAALPKDLTVLLPVYIVIGTVYLLLGLNTNMGLALRDIVFCHYTLFMFITLSLMSSAAKLEQVPRLLIPGIVAAVLIGLKAYFIYFPIKAAFIQFVIVSKTTNLTLYCGLILIFSMSFFYFVNRKMKWLLGTAAYLCFLFIIISEIRAAWVGVVGAFILLLILMRKEFKIAALMILLMVVSIFLIGYFDLGLKPGKVAVLKEELSSMGHKSIISLQGANIKFRLDLWKETWEKIKERPVLGSGFGKQIDYLIWGKRLSEITAKGGSNGIMPAHSHLLAITYKMGFIGLLLFLYINARIFFYGVFYTFKCKSEFNRRFLMGSLGALIYWHGMASFFDILESPPTGIFLWILLGSILAIVHFDKQGALKLATEDTGDKEKKRISSYPGDSKPS
jgi:O-antigen ligase